MLQNTIIIADTLIRLDAEGRFCLNDLHKAAGALSKDQPSKWLILESTKALIDVIDDRNLVADKNQSVRKYLGGNGPQGTYVCKALVYAYAMWISPVFHLRVIDAYDAIANIMAGQLPAQAQTAEHYESEYARLQAELERLEVTPIYVMPAEWREACKPYIPVGTHHVRVVDFVAMTETHGVPRKAVEELLGINNNNVRQHAIKARRAVGGAQ